MHNNRHLPPNHLLHGKRVAITGGGPAGLTLARLLQMRGVAVTVFERDPSPDARGQGGSLDLHEDSGQRALAAAGLADAFRSHACADGQHTRVFDKHGVVRADMRGEDEAQSQPEIDRGTLRDLLLASLEPGTVQWSRRLIEARRTAEGLALVFGGETIVADVVFGCDGGWSKVRPLVSNLHEPDYSGVVFVQSFISDVERRHPNLAAVVGPGKYPRACSKSSIRGRQRAYRLRGWDPFHRAERLSLQRHGKRCSGGRHGLGGGNDRRSGLHRVSARECRIRAGMRAPPES